jgi:hypothetical protein
MRVLATLLICLFGSAVLAAERRDIANPLGQDWPWELVSMDFPSGVAKPDWVATIDGVNGARPCQVERVTVDGKEMDRVWFVATLAGTQKTATVTFDSGKAVSPLSAREDGAYTVIDNGVYEFRLANYAKLSPGGKRLGDVPHWLGGLRVKGEKAWDGRAAFEGTSVVASVEQAVVSTGPVFMDYKITYRFADPGEDGTVEAVPLMLGKQSFRFEPNVIPAEKIPKRDRHYELKVRFVMGDPWAEIVERYHLPPDESASFKIHQYIIHFGQPTADIRKQSVIPEGQFMPLDTVMWARWFEYDAFGGNNQLQFVEARPRPPQKGRPFAQLRARWNQGPGGAQDFFVTRGGQAAMSLAEMEKVVIDRIGGTRKYAEKGQEDATKRMANVPQAEDLLAKAKASPAEAEKLLREAAALLEVQIPSGVGYAPANPAVGFVAAYPSKWVGPYDATISANAYDGNRAQVRLGLSSGGKHAATGETLHYGGRCYAICVGPRSFFDATGKLDALVRRHSDWTLTALINKYDLSWHAGKGGGKGPKPSQYLGQRYQVDDVNPTNYGNRRMVNEAFLKTMKDAGNYGPLQAAVGYIYSDLDSWPGWHNGWGPGNPNFHTDKYMAAIYAGVSMRDHPHAKEWLAFGRSCLDGDLAKVFIPPDGVGAECPGYSGYSLGLQTEVAKAILDAGCGNPLAENPLTKKTITWHRKLLTPFDRRLGLRHEAPIGDTHRWNSGLEFAKLLPFFEKSDAATAGELRLADDLCKRQGPGGAGNIDWSSQAFAGFGAILRHRFGEAEESFLTLKSGPVSGHYHNDDQSFHWYHRGTPIALDYNCSYHPRGDHAALHNTLTFGQSGKVKHNGRNADVEAREQPFGPAQVVRFAGNPAADLVVADRRIGLLSLSPVDPYDSEFNRDYPNRAVTIAHRRLLLMTKHPKGSPLSDYIVVRDEVRGSEPQQVNLHLLARDARITDHTVRLTGQWEQDIVVQVVDATDLKIESSYWAYADEWQAPPDKEGKVTPVSKEQTEANLKRWHELIRATDGTAMMPPPGSTGTWKAGECQRWLQLNTRPGTPVTVVIYPYVRGGTEPRIAREGDAITVTVGETTDRIVMSTEAGCTVSLAGAQTELVKAGALPGASN